MLAVGCCGVFWFATVCTSDWACLLVAFCQLLGLMCIQYCINI